MNSDNPNTETEPTVDRRTVLQKGALATGGLVVGGAGIAGADKPVKYEKDLTGKTFDYIPCLGEGVEIKQGTVAITVDKDNKGDCWHFQFHWHYTERLVAEGLDTGRIWTGQGSKNNTFTVCRPYPGEQTVTNSTTITSKTAAEDTVVQFRFIAHVTVNATGEVAISFQDGDFLCRA
ncbi:MAG: hypothetical protein ABEH66_07305 [Halobacteriales archaeon]